ncbi:MAG TPA: TauD/TfdA family dioxygenase, partial [Acidobacteriota bacterium]|nr:TauD/TfdA family dioxygenase [Acidobacteriota bacterium]
RSNLPASVREVLESSFAPDELPRHAFFGDGTPIDPAALEIIRQAFDQVTVAFPWERGDLELVDNLLVSHGRRPYTGERKVIVAMAEPISE